MRPHFIEVHAIMADHSIEPNLIAVNDVRSVTPATRTTVETIMGPRLPKDNVIALLHCYITVGFQGQSLLITETYEEVRDLLLALELD